MAHGPLVLYKLFVLYIKFSCYKHFIVLCAICEDFFFLTETFHYYFCREVVILC